MANYVTVNMRNRQLWEQVTLLEDIFPTLRADILHYGMPARMHPLPEWSAWKMRVAVNYEHADDIGEGWHFWELHWLRNLQEVARTYGRVVQTTGFYRHLDICLSEWCWDYLGNEWGPRNCI